MASAELAAYLRERILTLRVGALWLMLVAVCAWAGGGGTGRLVGLAAATAAFILGFRLWDDLADLELDREAHPARVLSRSRRLGVFRVACGLSICLAAGLLTGLGGWKALLGFVGLVAAFFAVYRLTRSGGAIRAALVLSKYPLFVSLLLPRPMGQAALAAIVAAYGLPLLDEMRTRGTAMLAPGALVLALVVVSAWLPSVGEVP